MEDEVFGFAKREMVITIETHWEEKKSEKYSLKLYILLPTEQQSFFYLLFQL